MSVTRIDFRITLSNVDRGVERSESVVIAQHPSETTERVVIRALSWCLLNEERIAFGPGLSSRDTADLWTHDLSGRLQTWIECGSANADEIKRVMQQNAGVDAHAVFGAHARYETFEKQVQEWAKQPKNSTLTAWLIAPSLVSSLVADLERRQTWTVTVASDHFYIDSGKKSVDGEVTRTIFETP